MAELNWRKSEDYEYLKELDDKGWAWEFIRRSPSYRAAYAEISALPDRRKKIFFYPEPPHKGETERAWKVRVYDQSGVMAEKITKGQKLSRDKWALCKMYAPQRIYNPGTIDFVDVNPCPVFWGDVSDLPEKEKAKNAKMLAKLRHPENIFEGQWAGEHIIMTAFDVSKNIDAQIDRAKKILEGLSAIYPASRNETSLHRKKWKDMIRMLDALDAAEGLPLTKILKEIDKSPATQNATGKLLSDKASRLKNQGIKMAEHDYHGLVFRIQRF